jgi:hypothetical protein
MLSRIQEYEPGCAEVFICSLVVGQRKMEAVCFFETLVSTYESTRRYNLEDQHRLTNS